MVARSNLHGRLALLLALSVAILLPEDAAAAKDKTPPKISVVAVGIDGSSRTESGWFRTSVRVLFTCSDKGGSKLAYCPPAQTLTTQGANQVVTGTAYDVAGNQATATITVQIDLTRPLISVALSPTPNPAGYYKAAVTAHFTCSDAVSGINTCPADRVFRTDGQFTVSGIATDRAGNSASTDTTFTVDTTPPVVSLTMSRNPDKNGWYTAPASASFACSDALSGVAQCPTPVEISSEGANQQVQGTALDRAGNQATASKTVHLDTTAPSLTISSPADGAVLTGETVTISGTTLDTASGIASLEAGALKMVGSNGTFTLGPLSLVAGANTFTIVATNGAGLKTTRTLTVVRSSVPPTAPKNLIEDPQFESGLSNFEKQETTSTLTWSATAPLEGARSLAFSHNRWGSNLWWFYKLAGGRATQFAISAHLRSDLASRSTLHFCAMAFYTDASTAINCMPLTGAAGDKGTVSVQLTLDPTRSLESVRIRLVQEGDDRLVFTLDQAVATLAVVQAPPPGEGERGGGGGGGGGGEESSCPVPEPGSSAYPGFRYTLPAARPFISLSRFAQTSRTATPYLRFKAAADAALAGTPPYNYSATHSVIMYTLTGTSAYLDDAIARVEAYVAAAEAAIAAGGVPIIANGSYLEVGWQFEPLAVTYDYGYGRLTAAQRQRWAAFAEQTLQNLWHPTTASWGGVARPWSGWSLCDPGNNYHFSFLRATMLWALATKSTVWLDFLQTQKFGPLIDYYAQFPGGGSREGTGYGTSHKNLFENYLYWGDSTGERLDRLTAHTRETIDYWVHATVPTRDRFAPIGDQARVSIPDLYDYQENLVHQAVLLSQGTNQATRGTWWLQNNSVKSIDHAFNLFGDLLPYPDPPVVPTELMYHARAAGVVFGRSSWSPDAAWFSLVAGKYDQSHAHQDQGAFTFFRGDWLAVTANIWSRSGIHQEGEVHNVLRFERADGSTIPQTPSDTVASSMTATSQSGLIAVAADLTNAYSRNSDLVQSWTRSVELLGTSLRIADTCRVAPGVRPVFQLQAPTLPALLPNGSIIAGTLVIMPLQGVSVSWTANPAPEFNRGYRIDFTSTVGCSFAFELRTP